MARELSSLDEMLFVIDQEITDLENLKSDLKFKSKGRIRRFFSASDYEKERFKLYKRKMKGNIKNKKKSIEKLENDLDELCTFDFNVASWFLAEALSIIEGEKYQKLDLELCSSCLDMTLFLATKIPLYSDDYEDVCLIATKRNVDFISRLYNSEEIEGSDDIHDALDDNKYILLDSDDTYTMFDIFENEVPYELIDMYPYLSEVVCDLISLKIENQELADDQIAIMMLQQMPERYSHLIENKRMVKYN